MMSWLANKYRKYVLREITMFQFNRSDLRLVFVEKRQTALRSNFVMYLYRGKEREPFAKIPMTDLRNLNLLLQDASRWICESLERWQEEPDFQAR